MPCENCNVQFTFLKRKRNCNECSRFYCSQCLDKRNTNIYLCERCVIFTTRPISKVDLLKLKPKDLIFYLQSKHISTAGCVEKEELVNLVLAHVNSDGGQQIPNNEGISGQDPNSATFDNNCSNPFDQFKQSCQNFFTNFTGKISSDLNFEQRTASSNVANVQVNISDQPRVSTRQIPTYASSIHVDPRQQQHQSSSPSVTINNHNGFGSNSNGTNANTFNNQNETPSFNNPTTAPNIELRKANVERTNIMRDANSSSSLSSPSSPIISVSSLSSQSISSQTQAARAFDEHFITPHSNNIKSTVPNENISSAPVDLNTRRILNEPGLDRSGSGCECSDDEIITKFQTRNRIQKKSSRFSPSSQTDSAFEDQIPGPSGSVPESNSTSKSSTGNQKNSGDSSGSSSFEELGAVGRVSPSDNEHWQFVNKTEMGPFEEAQRTNVGASKAPLQNSEYSKEKTFQFSNITIIPDSSVEGRKRLPRRMIRRRSDSSIYGQRRRESEFSPFPLVSEESDGENVESSQKRQRQSCKKCGKNKRNLEKCIAKFINQLHSTQMSRVDIKQEADAFLVYLQNRKSFDCSDSESNGADADSQNNTKTDSQIPQISMNRSDSIIMEMETGYGNDDGIHVYALNASDYDKHDSRFMNLWDIRTSSEIDELSVKQLKEILMLNRVDYKGCCEKQELLERVHRLWKDSKTSPAVDKLGVDDLCKICMDAPIECVMLECGHMATCTNCGKVLSECPICRQYVVRVVRFFKA